MSERIQSKLNVKGNASMRSPEEQQRLMNEYDDAMYESGVDDAAYEEAMAKREFEKNAVIEGRIMENAKARRMYMMAQQVAELKANGGNQETISEKEDKLQDLLVAYSDAADGTRAVENRNAEAERDTVKGNSIRLDKQIAAEEAHAERMEEVDFILAATEQAETVSHTPSEENIDAEAEVAVDSDPEAASSDGEGSESDESKPESDAMPFTEADQAELNKQLDDEVDSYVPKHRAEYQDEESPIYDELKNEQEGDHAGVKEGESLEEYEARQPGKHRSTETEDDDLEILPVDGADSVAEDDDLEILPVDGDDAEEVAPRRSRLRRFGTPSGIAAEASAWAATRERGGRRRNRVIAGLGGAALLVGGGLLLLKGHNIFDGGGSGSGKGGNGGGFGDFFTDIADKAKNGADSISDIDIDADKKSGLTEKIHELFGNGNVEVRPGDGYTQVIDRVLDGHDIHLSSNELYDLHQHLEHAQGDYIDLNGARDTYVMPNGDNGLNRPDMSAKVSEATQKAVVRWLQTRGKI